MVTKEQTTEFNLTTIDKQEVIDLVVLLRSDKLFLPINPDRAYFHPEETPEYNRKKLEELFLSEGEKKQLEIFNNAIQHRDFIQTGKEWTANELREFEEKRDAICARQSQRYQQLLWQLLFGKEKVQDGSRAHQALMREYKWTGPTG